MIPIFKRTNLTVYALGFELVFWCLGLLSFSNCKKQGYLYRNKLRLINGCLFLEGLNGVVAFTVNG